MILPNLNPAAVAIGIFALLAVSAALFLWWVLHEPKNASPLNAEDEGYAEDDYKTAQDWVGAAADGYPGDDYERGCALIAIAISLDRIATQIGEDKCTDCRLRYRTNASQALEVNPLSINENQNNRSAYTQR